MTKKSRLGNSKGESGRSGMDKHFGGFFWMQTVVFGMDGQWDSTVQHREMCVIGSICCKTELDETL